MLNIHIGPHKTATTYIQSVLKNSNWKPGYKYYDIYESRRSILPELNNCAAGTLPNFLQDQSQTHVLSDENIIGGPQGPLNMYPGAASALKWASGNSANIYFSLRPYHEIYVSSWIESLRFYPYFPFREGPSNRGYHHVLAEIERQINPGSMNIWLYSDFRSNSTDIMQLIAGGGISKWGAHDSGDERISPSGLVVDLYANLSKFAPESRQPELFKVLRETPELSIDRKYTPYNPSDIERLTEKFLKDCEKIRSRYGIWSPS